MSDKTLSDSAARQAALDTTQSFIVQAPAGSGKTGLLVQRFLALLAAVEKNPEECLCITFTRKAAAEMKARVVSVLQAGSQPFPDAAPDFVQKNWHLAQAVIKRDHVLGWHLLENPQRLQIQTIDALCARIVRQMPLMSGFGVLPEVAEDPTTLYEQAVLQVFEMLGENAQPADGDPLHHVLSYLDNDSERLKQLLISLLPKRDQWLPYVVGASPGLAFRRVLEQGLQSLITEHGERLQALCEAAFWARLAVVFPDMTRPAALDDWLALADILLTKEGDWRKQVTEKQGFRAPSQAKTAEEKKTLALRKAEFMALVADWKTSQQGEPFRQALHHCRGLPAPTYTEEAWELVAALFSLLPKVAAQLAVVFQEMGEVDFVEINMAASRALGDADAPSELLLHLDARLRHLLVDEFQDTSRAQCQLLEKLMAGWQPGDGRTLFLVGDPMQSIYRFRQAEVGLFLQAAQQGIGNMPLEKLNLGVNFRSIADIVAWNNDLYADTFPKTEDIGLGAVCFWPSESVKKMTSGIALTDKRISGLFYPERDDQQEAQQIVAWIQATQQKNPTDQIAILVRTRSHLAAILPALASANIAYTGIDIETLGDSVMVRDVMTVTRAYHYLMDRVAWLALLRLPWCRLSLADCETIVRFTDSVWGKNAPLWAGFQEIYTIINKPSPNLGEGDEQDGPAVFALLNSLSQAAKVFIQQTFPLWEHHFTLREQRTVRDGVEALWHDFGGERYYRERFADYDAVAQQYFALLETDSAAEWLLYPPLFESKIARTFKLPTAPPNTGYPPVLVMTLHKAKGLEFDTVILPGLGKAPLKDKKQLLLWGEHINKAGTVYPLFAPIVKGKTTDSPIYRYLQSSHEQRLQLEALRLLYVATTRAKKQLLWCGHVKEENPQPGSLLSLVWSALQPSEEAHA